jgi:hypothetical protein
VVKLRMFRVGKGMPTVSRTEGQCLLPLKTFIKIKRNNNSIQLFIYLGAELSSQWPIT